MPATITTTAHVHAAPQVVWDVLTDFASYGQWNPFMDRISGQPVLGARLVVHMTPPGGRAMTFKPTVTAVEPARELRWLGKLAVGGLFDGEHSFLLAPDGDGGTVLTHAETFTGLLVAPFKGTVNASHAGFEAFNTALKQRAETTAAAQR